MMYCCGLVKCCFSTTLFTSDSDFEKKYCLQSSDLEQLILTFQILLFSVYSPMKGENFVLIDEKKRI